MARAIGPRVHEGSIEGGSVSPKILILHCVPERGPVIETEGAQLFLALKRLGCRVTLTGPGYTNDLRSIPELARDFDVCLLTDNYPQTWSWNRFEEIEIPKMFWAIDTSHQFFPFVTTGDFQHVLFNNSTHIDEFMSRPAWSGQLDGHTLFPYAFDPYKQSGWEASQAYRTDGVTERFDLVFCGTVSPDRKERIRIIEQSTGRRITILQGFGQAYVDNILSGTLHLNLPILGDFNGKHMDVLGLDRVLLTPYQPNSTAVLPESLGIYFHSLPALNDKVEWLLSDVEARTQMLAVIRQHLLQEHTWERRAETLIAVASDISGGT